LFIYKRATGAEVHWGKSFLMALGSLYDKEEEIRAWLEPYLTPGVSPQFAKKGEAFDCLGAPVGIDLDMRAALTKTVEKVAKKAGRWFRPHLNMVQRITVANTIIAAPIAYIGQFVHIPKKVTKAVEKLMRQCVSRGKKVGKVKRDVLHRERKEGGLELYDLNILCRARRLSAMRRLLHPANTPFTEMILTKIHKLAGFDRNIFGRNVLGMKIYLRAADTPSDKFWRALIKYSRRIGLGRVTKLTTSDE